MLTLIVLNDPDSGQVFRLTGEKPVVAGRQSPELRLSDSRVSRQHATFYAENGQWFIRDLESTNGTYVNGRKIEKACALKTGDKLVLGRVGMVVGHITEHKTAAAAEPSDTAVLPDQELASGADELQAAVETPTGDAVPRHDAEQEETTGREVDVASATQDDDEENDVYDLVADELEIDSDIDEVLESALGSRADDDQSQADPLSDKVEVAEADEPAGNEERDDESYDIIETPDEKPLVAELLDEPDNRYHGNAASSDQVDHDDDDIDEIDLAEFGLDPGQDDFDMALLDESGNEIDVASQSPPPTVQASPEAEDKQSDGSNDDPLAADSSQGDSEDKGKGGQDVDGVSKDSKDPHQSTDNSPQITAGPEHLSGRRRSQIRHLSVVLAAMLTAGLVFAGVLGYQNMDSLSRFEFTLPRFGEDRVSPQPVQDDDAVDMQSTSSVSDAGRILVDTGPVQPEEKPVELPTKVAVQQDTVSAASPGEERAELTVRDPGSASVFDDGPTIQKSDDVASGSQVALASQDIPLVTTLNYDPPVNSRLRRQEPMEGFNSRFTDRPGTVAKSSQWMATVEEETGSMFLDEMNEVIDDVVAEEMDDGAASHVSVSANEPMSFHGEMPARVVSTGRQVAGSRYEGKVAYLIDSSGSLVDCLPELVRWVERDIENLGDEASFTVFFFRHGQVFESPPSGLTVATDSAKQAVYDWLGRTAGGMTFGGWSDPLDAIDLAISYGAGSLVILSDDSFGRSLLVNNSSFIADQIRRELRPGMKIDTVQFFYIDDRLSLKRLAEETGGRYEFIPPPDHVAVGETVVGTATD